MSTTLMHSLFVLVPLGLAAVLYLLIYREKDPHPETYQMSDPWTHAPILWAAEEPADHGHSAHGAGHDSHPLTVGGGASGKW